MKTKKHNPWGTEHNMDPNCGWAVPKRFWALPDTRWLGKWAVKEKKKQTILLYYLQ